VATYVIGDIQGCQREVEALLSAINFSSTRDRLWLVGDLVNRGPRSLDTLRWAKQLGDAVTAVLGNHDLHLLARVAGSAPAKHRDTLDDILAAPDRDVLIDWLRSRPLLHCEGHNVMVHAGLHPTWTIDAALGYANEIQVMLRGDDWQARLADMLATKSGASERMQQAATPRWSSSLVGSKRWRTIVQFFTRARVCFADGNMNPDFDGPLAQAPRGCFAWFDLPDPAWSTHRIITGHWAALGFHKTLHTVSLDTGCVWGKQLTAFCLDDERRISVDAARF
jgi:bis(5'-nucleosyl)-tetraphosphatase (symmetrical)